MAAPALPRPPRAPRPSGGAAPDDIDDVVLEADDVDDGGEDIEAALEALPPPRRMTTAPRWNPKHRQLPATSPARANGPRSWWETAPRDGFSQVAGARQEDMSASKVAKFVKGLPSTE